MTDKELKSLNRTELLEMLLAATRENQLLQDQVDELHNQLESRNIAIDEAGSIAEAALKLNGVFEAAEASAEQYMENIKKQEQICQNMQKAAEERAAKIIMYAKQEAQLIESQAKQNAEKYWTEVSEKLEGFYSAHQGLQDLLKMTGKK